MPQGLPGRVRAQHPPCPAAGHPSVRRRLVRHLQRLCRLALASRPPPLYVGRDGAWRGRGSFGAAGDARGPAGAIHTLVP